MEAITGRIAQRFKRSRRARQIYASLMLMFLICVGRFEFYSQTPAVPALPNVELESRLKAVLSKSSGIWGLSIKHVQRHEIVGINADQKFQMASVFKIPVLVDLFQQVKEGKLALDERVEWNDPKRYFGSGILVTLGAGLRPTIRDLATLMIIVSDNAATDLLCRRLGVAHVTARMRALGLTNTSVDAGTRELILQALGLRGDAYRELTTDTLAKVEWSKIRAEVEQNQRRFLEDCPNGTTPDEMARLLEMILTGQAADKQATDQMLGILSRQQFNHRLPRGLPAGIRCDHKTGTLTSPVWVVNDVGIIYLPGGHHVIVTVFSRGLQKGFSSAENKAAITNAEDRIAEIGKAVFDYYTVSARAK